MTTSFWHLRRDHGIVGQAAVSHYLNERTPRQLREADAVALAGLLKQVRAE